LSTKHIEFNLNIGKQKPESIINTTTKCPFCDRESLEGIIAADGPILLVKNKYPVLQDTVQTVLIETDECTSELSLYPKEHLYRVFRFGIDNWQQMEREGHYKSVIFFKNHGPFSGGTIRHPHMQIIGLNTIDYMDSVYPEHFEGLVIHKDAEIELNLSTKPRVGFFEFNAILSDLTQLNRLADDVQSVTRYILGNFHRNCNSYNLFFYKLDHAIAVKIMPRFVTSPLFIGFAIPQVSSRLEDVVLDFQEKYLVK
jgi:ATP adenylyltransferase/5',5'''-P-1,P-4-tetraphosphate phosphorylase II